MSIKCSVCTKCCPTTQRIISFTDNAVRGLFLDTSTASTSHSTTVTFRTITRYSFYFLLFIYLFIYPFNHPFICCFIDQFIHSFIPLFVYSFIYFIHLFFLSFIHFPIHVIHLLRLLFYPRLILKSKHIVKVLY